MLSVLRLITCVSLFVHLDVNAQDTLAKKITNGLEHWSKSNPTEKTFLHTDKSTYLAGENIWYKAYVTLDGEPSFLSKIVYVDLVDEKGKVVEKQMRPVSNGSSSGDIIIPRNLPTGNYSINAYTLWMLNFKPFVFQKNVRIYNNDYKPAEVKNQTQDFAVQFFPEGGELIENLKSTVGFYATNKLGLPIDVKGAIFNQSNKKITEFATSHAGYGKIEFTPAIGDDLIAIVNINGFEKSFKLPKPKKEGISLNVNNSNPNRAFVQLYRNVSDKSKFNELLVIAQMHGKPVYIGKVNFNEDATAMAITKKNLPAGIMHITVFDLKGMPLAERLAFINNHDINDISISTDSVAVTPRGKNKYKIDLSKFLSPSVSIAVTDADLSNKKGSENNIISNLFLTSDLRGYIHNPGYYFENKNPETIEHLDMVMLTHGWRRFKWDDILNNKDMALKYPVESGISLGGKVTIPQSSKTIGGGHVDIITKGEDSTTILSKATVDANGNFYINDLNFKQKATVYLQGSKSSNKNANVDVLINKSYIDSLKKSENIAQVNLDTFVNASDNKLLAFITQETEKNKFLTLSEVKVTAKRISRVDSLNRSYASDIFQLGQSLELTSSHYISIWQFLREQVNGLVVEGDMVNPNVYFTRFANTNIVPVVEEEGTNDLGGIETNGVTYFLNEINVSKDVISTLHPTDIALVKVFKGPEGAALGISEGGIAIYTKKGINNKNRPGEKGFFTEQILGYALTREFFNPDYSSSKEASLPDNRTTLYWNPNLKTDKNGQSTIKFYNNDMTKKYKVVVQGIDKQGKLVFKELVIQ